MAKSMRNNRREEKRLMKNRADLVRAAMDAGAVTRREICKLADLKINDIVNLFASDRELFAEWKVRKKAIVDQASENIHNIVNDPTHPKHYDASKYIVQNYKSDLDDVLEPQDSETLEVSNVPQIGEEGTISPVRIIFTKKSRD